MTGQEFLIASTQEPVQYSKDKAPFIRMKGALFRMTADDCF
jgi:hypothetical protein